MRNANPSDDHNCFEDQSQHPPESKESSITDDCNDSVLVQIEPKIEGWVTGTLSDVISSLNENEMHMLLRDIQNRKKGFEEEHAETARDTRTIDF